MDLRIAAAAAAIALAFAGPALAQPAQLKFASPAPPQSPVNTWGIQPWIEEVQKASDGTVEIKAFLGPTLGNFNNIYERTISGVTDLAFGVFGPMAGQFPRTDVSSLPFEGGDCRQSSIALWRLLDQGLIAGEYDKIKPMALFVFPGSGVHTKKEVKAVDDLKGLKVAVFARVGSHATDLLGATPVTMTPSDAYQSVARGLADSIMVGWSAVVPFKYFEVVNWHLEAPLGQAPAFVFMNKQSYAKLPAKAKAAVDRYGYEAFSNRMGSATDRMEKAFRGSVGKMPGHTIYSLNAAQTEIWKRRVTPIIDEWIKGTPDGAKVIAAYRAEIAKLQ